MTEPKTIRVQLDDDPKVGVAEGRYKTEDVAGGEFTWIRVPYRFPREARELDIAITPVKSLKQQRREARGKLIRELPLINRDNEEPVLKAIERADAEFDREREVELRKEAKRAFDQALSDLGRRGNFSDKERAHILDAIEAIYRGER